MASVTLYGYTVILSHRCHRHPQHFVYKQLWVKKCQSRCTPRPTRAGQPMWEEGGPRFLGWSFLTSGAGAFIPAQCIMGSPGPRFPKLDCPGQSRTHAHPTTFTRQYLSLQKSCDGFTFFAALEEYICMELFGSFLHVVLLCSSD